MIDVYMEMSAAAPPHAERPSLRVEQLVRAQPINPYVRLDIQVVSNRDSARSPGLRGDVVPRQQEAA